MVHNRTNTPLEDYITRAEWAKARGVSLRTIKRDEVFRRGPRPIRIGQRVYYRKSDLAAWLDGLAEQAQ